MEKLIILEDLTHVMSEHDLCEYWKELNGINTNHFTKEVMKGLRILSDKRNVYLLAHFWLFSNRN